MGFLNTDRLFNKKDKKSKTNQQSNKDGSKKSGVKLAQVKSRARLHNDQEQQDGDVEALDQEDAEQ
jgi:hypothetical protein